MISDISKPATLDAGSIATPIIVTAFDPTAGYTYCGPSKETVSISAVMPVGFVIVMLLGVTTVWSIEPKV